MHVSSVGHQLSGKVSGFISEVAGLSHNRHVKQAKMANQVSIKKS